MKLILLAAGFGTRLWPITLKTPKCLVRVGGKPLIQYWLEEFEKSKVLEELIINTHYLSDKVEEFIANWNTKKNITLFNEQKLLGTAGTLFALSEQIADQQIVLAHADNFTSVDLDELLALHETRPEQAEITMLLFRSEDPKSCGIVGLNQNSIVEYYREKPKEPKSNLANAALYVLDHRAVSKILKMHRSKTDFSVDVIPKFIGRIYGFQINGFHIDIGTKENLDRANKLANVLID